MFWAFLKPFGKADTDTPYPDIGGSNFCVTDEEMIET